MKSKRPRFELTRVYADGTSETPEIIPVSSMPWNTGMERRGFLGMGVSVASLLLLLDGCATGQNTGGQYAMSTNEKSHAPRRVPDKVVNTHTRAVTTLAISPDGKTLASGSQDNTLKLWSLPEGKLLATLEGHKDSVETLAISPHGKTLASGSQDKTLKLWSLPEGKLLATLEGHKHFVSAVAISPDGKTLTSGSWDKTLKLWSLPEGKLLATLEGHEHFVSAVAISPDGKTLASGSQDKTLKLWSLPEGKLLATLEGHKHFVEALAISPDGKTLASGSWDKTLKLWSLPEGKLLATLEGHKHFVEALAISPDGKTLASGARDNTLKLWSLPEGELLATLEGHKHSVNAVAISPDGEMLASGDDAGVVILWNFERRSFLSFLFDPKASQTDAITYNQYDKITRRTITFTLPCGAPIPPGAVCTCNCVSGTYRLPSSSGSGSGGRRGGSGGGGMYCTCNKVCTCIPVPSDRSVKEGFETIDKRCILHRLSELPIQKWSYKWDNTTIRHIGPMAQDFAEAFTVGEDDSHICPVDAQGVAFAAIQGLYQMIKEKETQAESLQAQLQRQQEENRALYGRIEALERLAKEMLERDL